MRQTCKMESIFKLEDKNKHSSHIIYKGKCICGQTYLGETACNLKVRALQPLTTQKLMLWLSMLIPKAIMEINWEHFWIFVVSNFKWFVVVNNNLTLFLVHVGFFFSRSSLAISPPSNFILSKIKTAFFICVTSTLTTTVDFLYWCP